MIEMVLGKLKCRTLRACQMSDSWSRVLEMNRRLEDEQSEGDGKAGAEVSEGVAGSGSGEGTTKPVGEGVGKDGVGGAPVKPKGTSITLEGCGRKDGSDIDNSMGLVEAYKMVVLR